ncbi:unnamed protein product [Durusdinium trenchii]|uniref:Uncharacterized protein n=2 Tax=Durusdinium trenchii TaxID=1381693 RepID=A0ABP0LTP0_9DINO
MPPVEVHSLWIGESFPDWLPHCVASYIRTGHVINWWIYPEERERDFELLQCNEVGQRLLASPLLRLRDANELLPLELARKMFFYGVGPERKWQGWAPFSDWFRYELLSRHPGSCWVDADSFSLQNLGQLNLQASLLCATEKHRNDRRTIGAAQVVEGGWSLPPTTLRGFHSWAAKATSDQPGCMCLVTNNFLFAPTRCEACYEGKTKTRVAPLCSPKCGRCWAQRTLQSLAEQMRSVLERGGRGIVGTHGMKLLQRAVRQGGPELVQLLHWSKFNPVEATEARRMHQILEGQEPYPGNAYSLHIFRQVRDEWAKLGYVPANEFRVASRGWARPKMTLLVPQGPKRSFLSMLIASRRAKETKEVSELLEEALEVKKAKKQSQQKRELALFCFFVSFCAWEEGLQKSMRRVV